MSIFDRQIIANKNWKQELLSDLKILIKGDNAVSDRLLLAGSALGIGTIYHLREPVQNKYMLLGSDKLGAPQEVLQGLFGKVKYIPVSQFSDAKVVATILDVSNNPFSKKEAIDYCKANKIFFQSISSTEDKSYSFHLDNFSNNSIEKKLEFIETDFYKKEHGSFTSTLGAGISLENLRRKFISLHNDDNLKQDVIYNTRSLTRFDTYDDFPCNGNPFYNKAVLLVGIGAVGNPIALDLVQYNLKKLALVDYDVVEQSNLNRQIGLFNLSHERTDNMPKAKVLGERLKKLNNKIEIEYHTEHFSAQKDYGNIDVVISAVDSFEARKQINDFAHMKMPFINTGTSFYVGEVKVAKYKETNCFNCSYDLENKLKRESDERTSLKNEIKKELPELKNGQIDELINKANSCSVSDAAYEKLQKILENKTQPAVIMPNLITAALALGELRTVFDSEHYGPLLNALIRYEAGPEIAFSIHPESTCDHYSKDGKWSFVGYRDYLRKRGHDKSEYYA